MATPWLDGVPYRILRDGASLIEGDPNARSDTDSGFARQRAEFTAKPDGIAGVIPMTLAEYEVFRPWRKTVGAFDWQGYAPGVTLTARFIAGEQGEPSTDPETHKLLIPVRMEFL